MPPRPFFTLLLLLLAAVYLNGRRRHPATRRQTLYFILGFLLLTALLLGPLHTLSFEALSWRALQQMLLVGVTPALLVGSNPAPVLLAGLPGAIRQWVEKRFGAGADGRRHLARWTPPGATLFLFAAVFWLWYDPTLHHAARDLPWLRAVEQLTLFGSAALYWWHIMEVAPRLHAPLPRIPHVLFALAGAFPVKVVGLTLMFARTTSYDYGPAQSQAGGATLVWLLGGVTFSTAAAILMRRWLTPEADKPPLPLDKWSTPEHMRLPGVGN